MSFFLKRKNGRRESINQLLEKKDNILFLDYDGVVNTDEDKNSTPHFDAKCIRYLNRFCEKNHFHIVVSSSWKNYYHYKEVLYSAGLHRSVIIDGKTDECSSRSLEIKNYIKDHPYIDLFMIIDDENLNGFEDYLIKTEYSKGFNREKYKEAMRLYDKLREKR